MNHLNKENVTEITGLDNVESVIVFDKGSNLPRRIEKDAFDADVTTRPTIKADVISPRDGNTSTTLSGDAYVTGDLVARASLTVDGQMTTNYSTRPMGYATGAGDSVSQATSITTSVTINAPVGRITTQNASAAAGASHTFSVSNSTLTTGDTVVVNIETYTGAGQPMIYVSGLNYAGGTFDITIHNLHSANALDSNLKIMFSVIAGATT